MTRLDDLWVERIRIPFRRPVRFGSMRLEHRDAGLVHLVTDEGLRGLGEIAHPILERAAAELVDAMAEQLHGVDVTDTVWLDERLSELPETRVGREVRAAIETAALDVTGQADRSPLAWLLGGGASSVAVNGLVVCGPDPAAAAADASALAAVGFDCIKVKRQVGGSDVSAALRAIRDAVGPDIRLRLDLNGDLTEQGAIDWLPSLDWASLEYVEQPIPPDLGPGALARVRAAVPMAVAADEAVSDPDAAAELLLAGAADVMVVKPSRVGGPRQARRIALAAAAFGVGVTVSTLYETGVGIAAALHVAATIPGDRAHGLATAELLETDLVGGAMQPRDGRLAVPTVPGLGVALDDAEVTERRLE